MSDYYIDCKLTTLDPEGAVLTGYTVLELLEEKGIQADAIGGPPIGAHPIVSAVAAVSYFRAEVEGKGKPLPAFLIREQHKSYGLQKQIEGVDLKKITKVVIIDEVCTTGKSTREALKVVEDAGLQVLAVLSLVDREEGGSEGLRRDYTYLPIFTATELRQPDDQSANLPKLGSPRCWPALKRSPERDILCIQSGAIAGLREASSVCESLALSDLKIAGHIL